MLTQEDAKNIPVGTTLYKSGFGRWAAENTRCNTYFQQYFLKMFDVFTFVHCTGHITNIRNIVVKAQINNTQQQCAVPVEFLSLDQGEEDYTGVTYDDLIDEYTQVRLSEYGAKQHNIDKTITLFAKKRADGIFGRLDIYDNEYKIICIMSLACVELLQDQNQHTALIHRI